MSEERNPPLKLKSRSRPDTAAAPASASASGDEAKARGALLADATGEKSVAQENGLRLRSKPRLFADATAAVPTEPAADTASARAAGPSPVLFVDGPSITTNGIDTSGDSLPAGDAPVAQALMDLQAPAAAAPSLLPLPTGSPVSDLPAAETADAATMAALFSPPPGALIGGISSEPIAVPQPKVPSLTSFAPKPIHIRVTERDDKPPAPPSAKRPQDRKAFKVGIGAVGLLAAVALGVGGYFAFKTFQDLRSPLSANKPVKAAESTHPPGAHAAAVRIASDALPAAPQSAAPATATPAAAVSHPLPAVPASQAGRLIQAARHAAAPAQAELDDVLSAGDTTAATAPPPAAAAAPEEQLSTPVLPGRTPAINPAFVAFADALRINGVFQGTPARAHINGRTVRSGAILDGVLGVVFTGIDVTTREILLQDPSGAIIRKKY